MGGNRFVVRVLGLLILAVVGVGGIGTTLVLSRLELPQLDVAFLFIPWAVVTTTGMALLWSGAAVAVYFRTRARRRS